MTPLDPLNLKNLSPHLFWDVDIDNLDIKKNRKLVIQRVLDYGLLSDWQIILKNLGISEIAKTAISIKDLDKKSASFVALLSNIPVEQFLCFTSKQSTPGYSTVIQGERRKAKVKIKQEEDKRHASAGSAVK